MDNPNEDLPLFSYQQAERRDPQMAPMVHAMTSLSAAVQAWGEALEAQGRSIHTVKAFTADLRLVGKFVGAGQPIGQIGTHDLKNFLDWMLNHRGAPCSPKTYARRVTSIKSFYRWLVESGALAEDPAAAIPQQTVLSPLPKVLSAQEVERVLEAAEAARRGNPPDARPRTLRSEEHTSELQSH